jgi:hypothetical protein
MPPKTRKNRTRTAERRETKSNKIRSAGRVATFTPLTPQRNSPPYDKSFTYGKEATIPLDQKNLSTSAKDHDFRKVSSEKER